MPPGAILSAPDENVKRSSRSRDRLIQREKARARARTALALLGWHSVKQTSDISYMEMLMLRYGGPGEDELDVELSLVITVIIYELMHCLEKTLHCY